MTAAPSPVLPRSVDDITPASVTAMLSPRFPGTQVDSVQVRAVIRGTCTKVRLKVTYNDAGDRHGLPAALCLKTSFETHGLAGQVYPREVWFYQHLAPQIGGSLPRCCFAGQDEHQAVILMEDLQARNARFGSASDTATLPQARSLLRLLAGVHGWHWDRPELETLAGEAPRTSGCAVLDFSDQVLYQPANFERTLCGPRAGTVPRELRDPGIARHYLSRMIQHFDAGPRCLVHGDTHIGNTYYLEGDAEAGYIDWQTYARGHWAFDVSHLLCTGLATPDRRRYERELIEYYLDELERNGGRSPGFDAAWQAYRRMAFYGLAWALCPPQLQPEETCRTCAERVAAALDDLGTLEALDAPGSAGS